MVCGEARLSPDPASFMRLLAGCPPHFSRETRYGVRRESATGPTPRSRPCPHAATANGAAPAGPRFPWAAPGQRKGGPDRDPLLTPLTNTTRPVPDWILTLLASEFCTLTPAHKLQSAVAVSWLYTTPCALWQLHALVRQQGTRLCPRRVTEAPALAHGVPGKPIDCQKQRIPRLASIRPGQECPVCDREAKTHGSLWACD